MTEKERIEHTYCPGDKARVVATAIGARDYGDIVLGVGQIIEVHRTHMGFDGHVTFMANKVERYMDQRFIEPVAESTPPAKQCNCPMQTLMSTGCTCGGS